MSDLRPAATGTTRPPDDPWARPTPSEPASGWQVAFLGGSRWPAYLLAAVFVVGLVAGVRPVYGFVVAGVIALALERAWPRHAQARLRAGLRTDIIHWGFTRFLELGCLALSGVACWVLLHRLTIGAAHRWIVARPTLVQGALGFVLLTLLAYWHHRLSHRVGFLWRFHAVHHSIEQLDWVSAARVNPVELFFAGFMLFPPLIILGFRPVTVATFTAVTKVWAVIEHANVRWRLRWMDRIWPNVEYHHWHHSLDVEARDKNYGVPLWDTLFGTYYMPADRRPARYGIAEPMPETYVGQLTQPFRARTTVPTEF